MKLTALNDESIGKRLRFQRALLGLVQEDMARALGVNPKYVQMYEKGTKTVNWDVCRRYMVVTGCSFEELFN